MLIFKTRLIIFLMLASCVSLFGQYLSIQGSITDQDGMPLEAAIIYFSNEYGSYSDENGQFKFDIPLSLLIEETPFSIVGGYLGYENDTVELVYMSERNFEISFKLNPTSYNLEPIVISDAPKLHYRNKAEFVFDFEFFEDGMVILTKENSQYQVHFQNELGEITSTIDIPFASNRLKKSCIGDLHVIGEFEGIQLHFFGFKWSIVDRYEIDKYYSNVEPCVYKTEIGDYLFKHFKDFNQTIYYELFDRSGHLKWSHLVYNQAQKDYVANEFGRILAAYQSGVQTPDENMIDFGFTIDNKLEDGTWNGDLLDLVVSNNTHFAVSYFKDVVMNPIFAPVFIQNGEIVILDHLNNEMFAFGLPHMRQNRTNPIEYHKNGRFANRIIQDAGNEKIYAMMYSGQNIVLMEISTFDGSIVRTHMLPTKNNYESRFKLRNGFLYYIAQPDVNSALKWVYRQKLL